MVRLFIMTNSEAENIILGRDCNECVDNCTDGMREITNKCTENEIYMSRDQNEHSEQYNTKVL